MKNMQQIKKQDKNYDSVFKDIRNVVSTAVLWRKGIQVCLHNR